MYREFYSRILLFNLLFSINNAFVGIPYEPHENVQMEYRFHPKGATWLEAFQICLNENNATLAMPRNIKEMHVLKEILKRHPVETLPNANVLLGYHDLFVIGDYATMDGLPLQYSFHHLNKIKSNKTNERCGSMNHQGSFSLMSCRQIAGFFCQKHLESSVIDKNGYSKNVPGCPFAQFNFKWLSDEQNGLSHWEYENCVHHNYYLNQCSRSCCKSCPLLRARDMEHIYKLHLNMKTWPEARVICESEGGYLAIINSIEERVKLVEMLVKYKNYLAFPGRSWKTLLGFHDIFVGYVFLTVKGQYFNNTGFGEWAKKSKVNTKSYMKCGAMTATGSLIRINCSTPAVFFCEKEIKPSCNIECCSKPIKNCTLKLKTLN